MGLSAWWVVRPSHVLVLFVHGGLWPGGVGWWAVVVVVVGVVLGVVVVVVVVVVVAGALLAVVVVGLVVVVVPLVRPKDPLASCGAWGQGMVCTPWGCTAWWIVAAGVGPGLAVTAVQRSHVPGSVWFTAVVVF